VPMIVGQAQRAICLRSFSPRIDCNQRAARREARFVSRRAQLATCTTGKLRMPRTATVASFD
jgi:hypothetical protein